MRRRPAAIDEAKPASVPWYPPSHVYNRSEMKQRLATPGLLHIPTIHTSIAMNAAYLIRGLRCVAYWCRRIGLKWKVLMNARCRGLRRRSDGLYRTLFVKLRKDGNLLPR